MIEEQQETAVVAEEQEPKPKKKRRVLIDVRAEAEDFYHITAIELGGCSEDLVSLATRVLDIPVGSEFDASRLDQSATDLRGTQLFSGVELSTEPIAPGELQLEVDLANARMRAWRASVGTWNDNPWMVKAGWTHRNLFRRGRGFDVTGTFATHDQRQAYAPYFEELLRAAQSGLGDVLGHLDLVKRFGVRHYGPFEPAAFEEEIRAVLRAAIDSGMGLEINI